MGQLEVADLLLKKGASLSVVDAIVIKPSVILKQSNIKHFK
jgi:transketolase C-terminal domain/subunit